MQNFYYLLLNIGIILFPLAFSFEKQINHIKNLKSYLYSISIVSSAFIIWDIYATANGDWGFNRSYVMGYYFFNLPIEEVLFFITVPYALIFTLESYNFYFVKELGKIPQFIFILLFIGILCLAFYYRNLSYTSTVMIMCSVSLLLSYRFISSWFSNKLLLFLLLSYIPFFIVNYILTVLPIVSYSPDAIIGVRVTTIPLEDFFYSFAMTLLWVLFYKYHKEVVGGKGK